MDSKVFIITTERIEIKYKDAHQLREENMVLENNQTNKQNLISQK